LQTGRAGGLSVDLLVSTVRRREEVERLMASLASQSYRNFRAIILDQNDDDRLDPIVDRYREAFPLERIRVPPEGKSRAVNQGLDLSTADVVGFPDDDCWYPPGLLERVVGTLDAHPEWHGLSGRSTDEEDRPTQLRWDPVAGPVTPRNLFRRSIAFTAFYRHDVIAVVGRFDESFGNRIAPSGEIIGASDDSDYLLRALAAGFTHRYDPSAVVYHGSYSPHVLDGATMRKSYSYGIDHTRLLKKHGYPRWFILWRATQLLAAVPLFMLKGGPGPARFYWAMAKGRFRGMLLRPNGPKPGHG
jgi:glycosyltransferase involved in cell wall biosynthesis